MSKQMRGTWMVHGPELDEPVRCAGVSASLCVRASGGESLARGAGGPGSWSGQGGKQKVRRREGGLMDRELLS